MVDPDIIQRARTQWAPPDHPVFELVPPLFDELANQFYEQFGKPLITIHTLWNVYLQLLRAFQNAVDEATLDQFRVDFERSIELSEKDAGYGIIEGQKEWEEPQIFGDFEDNGRIDDGDILDADEQVYVIFDEDD